MKLHRLPGSVLGVALVTSAASAQTLLVVESTNDHVMLLSAVDGSVINDTFIDLNAATPPPSTPIEAVVVGDEIWVSDQVADTVFRFSGDGTTFLGTTTTGRDNMRGIALGGNGSFYASNSGTGGAGYDDACKEYQTDGTLLNVFTVGDPFDVLDHCGSLLIANILGDDIDRYAYDGTFLGTFHASDGTTGIDFPEQIAVRKNGNVLAGGFSTPAGIFEYDWQGNQLNYYAPSTGLRGIGELDNGLLIYTDGSGVHTFDPATGVSTTIVADVSGRYITRVDGHLGTNYCTSVANSTGEPALIHATGSLSLATNDFTVHAAPVPNQFGLFFHSDTPAQTPFGNGFLCSSGALVRHSVLLVSGNAASEMVDLAAAGFAAGQTTTWQFWFRDPLGGGAFFNTSNGLCTTWLP